MPINRLFSGTVPLAFPVFHPFSTEAFEVSHFCSASSFNAFVHVSFFFSAHLFRNIRMENVKGFYKAACPDRPCFCWSLAPTKTNQSEISINLIIFQTSNNAPGKQKEWRCEVNVPRALRQNLRPLSRNALPALY